MNMHETVLLKEAVNALAIKPEGIYVDATYGRGGHSREILARLGEKGHLLVFDRDPDAIYSIPGEICEDARFEAQQMPFSLLSQAIHERDFVGKVDGILFDLGVSSPQFDDSRRGFSFLRDGPLDMRMDPTQGISAKIWIDTATEQELAWVFKTYGEERFARRIAKAIVAERLQKSIETTHELAAIVTKANPAWERHKHPATRVFQAIRIHINQELEQLHLALAAAENALAPGGRLVVISFHSLEDRIVKVFMRKKSKGEFAQLKNLPIRESEQNIVFKLIGKPIYPSDEEIRKNPRARSAVMRIAEKKDE